MNHALYFVISYSALQSLIEAVLRYNKANLANMIMTTLYMDGT